MTDRIDDHLTTSQRSTAPILGNMAEQTMLNLILLARTKLGMGICEQLVENVH